MARNCIEEILRYWSYGLKFNSNKVYRQNDRCWLFMTFGDLDCFSVNFLPKYCLIVFKKC